MPGESQTEVRMLNLAQRGLQQAGVAESMRAPLLATPQLWLGARSPFGLALPDAQPSASTMYAPRGVWLDDQRLIVCDSGNHRVLIWNQPLTAYQMPADVVLGQPSAEAEGPAAGGRGPRAGFHLPTGVIVAEGKLLVADAWHHRILVWNEVPTRSDTPPDYAIGQSDLSRVEINRGGPPALDSLYWPYGLAWLGGRLYVTDTGNRRVLAWDGLPEGNAPADLLLGQPTADVHDENRGGPVAADSFRWPHDVTAVGTQLFVADAGNHRVLRWPEPPAGDGPAASALGQQNLQTAYELPYDAQGPARLRFPYATDSCEGVLAVADTANNRILFWREQDAADTFAPAADVIGQPDFAGNGENRWQAVDEETLCWPYGICFHRGTLAVADSGNNRVMLWDCRALVDQLKQPTR